MEGDLSFSSSYLPPLWNSSVNGAGQGLFKVLFSYVELVLRNFLKIIT